MSYDPAVAKTQAAEYPQQSYPAHPVQAQPVGQQQNANPITVQQVHVTTTQQVHQQDRVYAMRPAPGRWRDNICEWPSNIWPSCWCVCCCCMGMWIIGQISEKTNCAKFSVTMGTTVAIWILSIILALVVWPHFIWLLPFLFSFIWAIALRMHFVRTYNITECGPFGEFCTAFWCNQCSVCQMARHAYGYTKSLDGDSDPQRPDNYQPMQIV